MRKTFSVVKKRIKVFFRRGQASTSAQIPQNNSTGAVQSPGPVNPTNSDIGQQSTLPPHVTIRNPSVEEVQSSSLSKNGSSADHPLPSFTSNASMTPVIVRDGSCSIERPRSSSRMSANNGSNSAEQGSAMNETALLDGSGSMLQPQIFRRPGANFNPNTTPNTVQSHDDVLRRVQQVSFENANIYEFHGNQNVNYNIHAGSVLKDLARHSMLHATFDASARDPPPRCHPGTRLDILRSITEKLRDPSKQAQVDWLQGAAGVGKSAIMQTIAEAEANNNALGASLFFSRPNNRDDPQKVFTTIAYQLAIKEPSYQEYLAQRIAADPALLDKTMDSQFHDLIVVPFAQHQLLGGPRGRVILLDGLDECKGNREQCRVIKLIHGFASRYPSVPLRWVIASRPEEHLRIAFSEVRAHMKDSFREREVPIDSKRSVRDVELYLHNEFTKIQKLYPDLTIAYDKWPSETQFLTISKAASGLFIFASTVIRFIDDDENPVHRLNLVISFLEKRLKQRHSRINPLVLLDALYEGVLSGISSDTLNTVKLILGCLVIFPYSAAEKSSKATKHVSDTLQDVSSGSRNLGVSRFEHFRESTHGNLAPFWVCNILGLEQYVVYAALRKLRSVLAFPEPKHAHEEEIRFLHASFSDYLKDHDRSHNYSVNLDETATYLFRRFMTILRQYADHGSYDIDYSWSVESLVKTSKRKPQFSKSVLVDKAGYYWPLFLREHLEHSQEIMFRLLLPIEDIVQEIRQLDYSHPLSMSSFGEGDDLINCLKRDIQACLHEDMIQDVPLASWDKLRFLKSVYERQWTAGGFGYTDSFEGLSQAVQELGGNLEELERLLRHNRAEIRAILNLLQDDHSPELKATIFGVQPSKCRMIVREASSGVTWSFPYIAY